MLNKCPFHYGKEGKNNLFLGFREINTKIGGILKNIRNRTPLQELSGYVQELKDSPTLLSHIQDSRRRVDELMDFIRDHQEIDTRQYGKICEEISLHLESPENLRQQEALWIMMEEFVNGAMDRLYKESESIDFQVGNLYFAARQTQEILMEYIQESAKQVIQANGDYQFLVSQTGYEKYLESMIVESGIVTSVNIFTNYIHELRGKGISSREEILEIIKKNSKNIIDSAKSRNFGILLQSLEPHKNTFSFNHDFQLHYNLTPEKILLLKNQLGEDIEITYRGCPMLYSKGGRVHHSNLIDWSYLVTDLICRGLDWGEEK